MDEEGNRVNILTDLENKVTDDLKQGLSVDKEDALALLNIKFSEPVARIKGFILDLPLDTADGEFWLNKIADYKL